MIVADQFLMQWRDREAKIRHMSQTDALTELFNRRTAHETLTNILARPNQHPVAVILLDLDRSSGSMMCMGIWSVIKH